MQIAICLASLLFYLLLFPLLLYLKISMQLKADTISLCIYEYSNGFIDFHASITILALQS